MIDVNITFPREDMEAYREQMNRLVTLMGKEPKEAVRMAMIALLKALAASTRVAPKLRKVVKNKDPRAGKDRRVAVWGVEKYKDGKPVFSPIYRGGEYGAKLKYISRSKVLAKVGDEWVPFQAGSGEFEIPGLMQHWKRKISHRGLAKATWGWSAQRLFPTSVRYDGRKPVRQTYSVTQRGEGNGFSVTVSNDLDYITKALGGGRGPAVSSAMARAAVTLKNRIDMRLKGALK